MHGGASSSPLVFPQLNRVLAPKNLLGKLCRPSRQSRPRPMDPVLQMWLSGGPTSSQSHKHSLVSRLPPGGRRLVAWWMLVVVVVVVWNRCHPFSVVLEASNHFAPDGINVVVSWGAL